MSIQIKKWGLETVVEMEGDGCMEAENMTEG